MSFETHPINLLQAQGAPEFVTVDLAELKLSAVASFEAATGRTLSEAQTEMFIIELIAGLFSVRGVEQQNGIEAAFLAFARGERLDWHGAGLGTPRADGEADDRYRARLAMAEDALGNGLSRARYSRDVFNWHSDVRDVHISRPSPGHVNVRPLMNSRLPTLAEIASLQAFFDASEVHQGDDVNVASPTRHDFAFQLTLRVSNPDAAAPAEAAARLVLSRWALSLGGHIAPSEIESAARSVSGVVDAEADIAYAAVSDDAWRNCTSMTVRVEAA